MDSNDAPTLEDLAQARERTLAAGSARLFYISDFTWQKVAWPRRRRGGLLRPVGKLMKWMLRLLWKRATRNVQLSHQEAEGFVDFAGRRYMLDYGSYARLYKDGQEWDGRSGRSLSTLPPDPDVAPIPLWVLDLLAGAIAIEDGVSEEVRGSPCRCVTVTVDVSTASQMIAGSVALPRVPTFDKLLAFPMDVWLDDQHIRRVRFETEKRTQTVEFSEFGVALDDLVWTRLPTLRSPQEAAWAEVGKRPSTAQRVRKRATRRS